jgi:hypothetical protein
MADIVDEVAALIAAKRGNLPWWERLTPKQAATVAAVLDGWKKGRLGKARKTAARAISKIFEKHGISIGMSGVINWLDRMEK